MWLEPHSSAHWPLKLPVSVALNQVSLAWPGSASNLPPSSGIHHECATSIDFSVSSTVVSFGHDQVVEGDGAVRVLEAPEELLAGDVDLQALAVGGGG